MKPKKTVSAYVLTIGLLALSIVAGLVAFQIYSSLTKTQVTSEVATAIRPLDGTLDQAAIDNLKTRLNFQDEEINSVPEIIVTPIPTVSITPSITPTPSATLSATPSIAPSVTPTVTPIPTVIEEVTPEQTEDTGAGQLPVDLLP